MLFVTIHGGKPGSEAHQNNVHAYRKDGKSVTDQLLEKPQGAVLAELRSIRLFGDYLYVVNANRTENSILCYRASGLKCRFVGTFVARRTCEAILHPFDFTFDGAGHCYVSSQDTNVVTRLTVAADAKTATAAEVAPALRSHGSFLPGTFVASSVGGLAGMAATAVPAAPGLQYSMTGRKKHSVRGLAWANNALYVADQPAGRVKFYDADGMLLGESNQVESPVHLTVHDGNLYVTGGNEVLTAKLSRRQSELNLRPIPGLHVKNGSGMAFTPKGNVYIASRTENVILKFDSSFRPLEFHCETPGNPEFLLHV